VAYKSKKDQAKASKRHYEKHKDKIKSRTRARNRSQKKKNKNFVAWVKSRSCCIDCGETNPLVLDFDHVYGEKFMNISDMSRSSYSREAIMEEMDKCEVRCSNCHRIATAKRRNKNE
jgi:nicotinamide mononucleotide adenylyltransferase